MATVSIVGDV